MITAGSNRGFALIEVVISAAILSAGCQALSRGLRDAVRAFDRSEVYYRAALQLENALWDLDHFPSSGLKTSSVDLSEIDLPEAKVEVREEQVLSGNVVERQVQLKWGNPQRAEFLHLSSYRKLTP